MLSNRQKADCSPNKTAPLATPLKLGLKVQVRVIDRSKNNSPQTQNRRYCCTWNMLILQHSMPIQHCTSSRRHWDTTSRTKNPCDLKSNQRKCSSQKVSKKPEKKLFLKVHRSIENNFHCVKKNTLFMIERMSYDLSNQYTVCLLCIKSWNRSLIEICFEHNTHSLYNLPNFCTLCKERVKKEGMLDRNPTSYFFLRSMCFLILKKKYLKISAIL